MEGTRGKKRGTSLEVQWLGLHALTAEGPGSTLVRELRSQEPRGAAEKKKRGKKRKNRIWRTPNTSFSGRLSPLNNQDCSRQGTHIKFLLVPPPLIIMQHYPMLINSSMKGTVLTALHA